MSSPSQPGPTVSLSTSCCTLKGGTLPVAIVKAPSRDPVVEFMSHLQRDGNSCGAADKNIIMNIARVSPAVAETLLHETRGISNLQCPQNCASDNKREKINAVEKGVLRERRQGAFGAFTLCPETNRLVLGRYDQHPVRVDIEGDVNLKHTTWRWRDPIEMKLPKQITVLGHCTLPLEDLSENTRLVACVRLERLSL